MVAEYVLTWTEKSMLQLLPEIKGIHTQEYTFKNCNVELIRKWLLEVKAPFALFAFLFLPKHSSYLISPKDVDLHGIPPCH